VDAIVRALLPGLKSGVDRAGGECKKMKWKYRHGYCPRKLYKAQEQEIRGVPLLPDA
jgi:hypothetical protein